MPIASNDISVLHSRNHETVPIIFGVTGHRDIPESDVVLLQASVRDYLRQEVMAEYPNTSVILLSALAEGADRIAARSALEAGCRLGVFLPFEQEEYLRDFESERSKTEFLELLAHAEFVGVAPRLPGSDPDDRVQGYVAVGVTIARYAQRLIALWDGQPSVKPGGTAYVVNMFQTGVPSLHPMPDDIISVPECGPVEHILTRRSSSLADIPAGKVGTCNFLPPTAASHRATGSPDSERIRWDKVFACIDRFNRDAAALAAAVHSNHGSQSYPIIPEQLAKKHSLDEGKAKQIAWLYSTANCLSLKFQRKRLGAFKIIIGSALLAAFFAQLYSGPLALPGLLTIAIGWALLAGFQYRQVASKQLEEKYLDYRTLAEAARVQFFWYLSGLPDCPADHYLRDQRDELEWLRQAVRAMALPIRKLKQPSSPTIAVKDVLEHWVKHQLVYFQLSAQKQESAADRYAQYSRYWFRAAIATVLFTAAFHVITNAWLPNLNESVMPTLTVVYGMLFAASGTTKLFDSILAHQEQSNRYRKMSIYFGLCNKGIEEALAKNDLTSARLLFLAIGRQALAENADWLLLHRQRPIEVPLGA